MSTSPSQKPANEAARQTHNTSPVERPQSSLLSLVKRLTELAKEHPRYRDFLLECGDEISWELTGRPLLTEAIPPEAIPKASAEEVREAATQLIAKLELWAQLNSEVGRYLRDCSAEIKRTLPKKEVSPRDNILTLLDFHAAATVALLVRQSALSDWKVRQVLAELIALRLVEEYGPGQVFESGGGNGVGGDRVKLYRRSNFRP